MFTATVNGAPLVRARQRSRAAPFRSTNIVRGVISELCSARGMNSSGPIVPSSGWCQRTRASTPDEARGQSTFGW